MGRLTCHSQSRTQCVYLFLQEADDAAFYQATLFKVTITETYRHVGLNFSGKTKMLVDDFNHL